jgi:hypothetical protein
LFATSLFEEIKELIKARSGEEVLEKLVEERLNNKFKELVERRGC